MFNSQAVASKGFMKIGEYLPHPNWINTTLDYQIEHLDLSDQQTLNLAFNGTIFNNFTTGYRHLAGVPKPNKMPYYDPKINSTWQLFISAFMLEHAARTTLDEAPFELVLPWDFLGDPLLLTTDAVEAFFPFATETYGFMIPCDINVRVTKVWDFVSNFTNGSLSFNINVEADGLMHLPDGTRLKIGTAEFYNGRLIMRLNITNNTLMGQILSLDFDTAYAQTFFGTSRYECTPYTMNIVKFGALIVLNGKHFLRKGLEIPRNFSMLYIKDAYLGYFDEYIVLGLTPHFKKLQNVGLSSEHPNTKSPAESFMDRFMTNLYELTETMTAPFRGRKSMQESLYSNDEEKQNDPKFFELFDKKSGD
jgi:hypothetical protein